MTQERATPPDFWERVRQIATDESAKSYRSAPLRNASITGGGGLRVGAGSKFVVQHPTGGTLMLAGIYDKSHVYDREDGSYQPMFLMYRSDGTLAMSMLDSGAGGNQYLALWDRTGNAFVSDDTNSGQGMARPYLSGGFSAAKYQDFRYSTTSATFETVAHQYVTKQQPRLRVRVQASMDTSGTTGEMRVLVDGVQLGATSSEAFAIATRDFGPNAIGGTHMQSVHVEIQGRVTSGSGALRIEPLRWETLQS